MKEEYDLSGSIENPFIDSMKKNGYAVTVHYPPFDESTIWTYDEIVDNEMNVIRAVICEKIKEMSLVQVNEFFNNVHKAIIEII